jgi:hypothetical protein
MSRQPYIYTMPESFLKDKNVPARWRVLGVINGFVLNGGCFYGSNEWLMEQLGCTEPTVSAAFAELEKLNLVRIERTARSRKVYRKENDPSQFGSETQVEPAHDPNQLVPNSVSNSDKENTGVAIAPRVLSKWSGEGESEVVPKKEKDVNVDRAAQYWRELCKRETGLLPSTGLPTTKKKLKDAHAHLSWPQIKTKMEVWFEDSDLEDHEKIQITRCFSTVQIDKFKAENV